MESTDPYPPGNNGDYCDDDDEDTPTNASHSFAAVKSLFEVPMAAAPSVSTAPNDSSSVAVAHVNKPETKWVVIASKREDCCHILSYAWQTNDSSSIQDGKPPLVSRGRICFDRQVEAVAVMSRCLDSNKDSPDQEELEPRATGVPVVVLVVSTRDGMLWRSCLSTEKQPYLVGLDRQVQAKDYMIPCIPRSYWRNTSFFLGTKILSLCETVQQNEHEYDHEPTQSGRARATKELFPKQHRQQLDGCFLVAGGNTLGPPQIVYIPNTIAKPERCNNITSKDSNVLQSSMEKYTNKNKISVPVETASILGLEHVDASCTSIFFCDRKLLRPAVWTAVCNYMQSQEDNTGLERTEFDSRIIFLGFSDGSIRCCTVQIMTNSVSSTPQISVTRAKFLGSLVTTIRQSVVSILPAPGEGEETTSANIVFVGSAGGIFYLEHMIQQSSLLCPLHFGLPPRGLYLSASPLPHFGSTTMERNNGGIPNVWGRTNDLTKHSTLGSGGGILVSCRDGSVHALLFALSSSDEVDDNYCKSNGVRQIMLDGDKTFSIELPIRQDMAVVSATQFGVATFNRPHSQSGRIFLTCLTFKGSLLHLEIDEPCWDDILSTGTSYNERDDNDKCGIPSIGVLGHLANKYARRCTLQNDRADGISSSSRRVMKLVESLKVLERKRKECSGGATVIQQYDLLSRLPTTKTRGITVEQALDEVRTVTTQVLAALSHTGEDSNSSIQLMVEEPEDKDRKERHAHLADSRDFTTAKANNTSFGLKGTDSGYSLHVNLLETKQSTQVRICRSEGGSKPVFYGGTALSVSKCISRQKEECCGPLEISFQRDNLITPLPFLSMSANYGTHDIKMDPSSLKRSSVEYDRDNKRQRYVSNHSMFESVASCTNVSANRGVQADVGVVLALSIQPKVNK